MKTQDEEEWKPPHWRGGIAQENWTQTVWS